MGTRFLQDRERRNRESAACACDIKVGFMPEQHLSIFRRANDHSLEEA